MLSYGFKPNLIVQLVVRGVFTILHLNVAMFYYSHRFILSFARSSSLGQIVRKLK